MLSEKLGITMEYIIEGILLGLIIVVAGILISRAVIKQRRREDEAARQRGRAEAEKRLSDRLDDRASVSTKNQVWENYKRAQAAAARSAAQAKREPSDITQALGLAALLASDNDSSGHHNDRSHHNPTHHDSGSGSGHHDHSSGYGSGHDHGSYSGGHDSGSGYSSDSGSSGGYDGGSSGADSGGF